MPVLPLGVCLIAEAVEQAGHRVTLLDLMFEKDLLRAVGSEIKRCRYDAVGLSVRNIDNNSMQEPAYYITDIASLVRHIRTETDAPVILGGAALAIMPFEILSATGASCAVIGSGTRTFPSLLKRLSAGEALDSLPGIIFREEGTIRASMAGARSLDRCMAPDYRRWINIKAYRSRMAAVPVQTKLGCGFKCVYCTYREIEGEGHILQDPGNVARDVRKLTVMGFKDFEFVDSVFNSPPSHAMAVCEALARVRLPVRLQSMDVNPFFLDDDLLSAMEQAGFSGLGMTVESASDPVLLGLRKGFTSAHVHRAAGMIRSHGVPCLWIFMFGGPGETEDTVRETLKFAEAEIRPQDAAYFTVGIRIYPSTELETIAREQGVLAAPRPEMLAPVFYTSPGIDVQWMVQQVRDSVQRNMNFMYADSLNFPYLPALHRFGYRFGLSTPLWRHTRHIRKALRFFGMDV